MPSLARSPRALAKLALFSLTSILLLVLSTRTDVVSLVRVPPVDVLSSSSSSSSSSYLSSSLPPPPPPPKAAAAAAEEDMASASAAVALGWYAPAQTLVNNLTHVASPDTTGVYGFVYNSSELPAGVEYGGYNWCNMPHVRASEYVRPAAEYELVYVEVIHRHHKRTPYAANSFPAEPYPWDCTDEGLYFYAQPFSAATAPAAAAAAPKTGRSASAAAYWVGTSSVAGFTNPFEALATGFKGSCQFPQITAAGLDDSWQHGADLYGAYGPDGVGFLPDRANASWRHLVTYRVTNNVITSEVAGLVISGMWGAAAPASVPLLIQPDGVDGLEPSYACASASAAFGAIQSSANAAWAAHLDVAAGLYAELDGISGVPADDEGFHKSLDHYYDNLSARQCHGKPLPCKLVNATRPDGSVRLANDTRRCVSQEVTDAVYRFGNWEYSQIYRDAGAASLAASVASLGVWIAELSAHLKAAVAGSSSTIWFHNVAHDGSVSRVLSVLQIDVMVWPGMGSEVVFELWKSTAAGDSASGQHYVRVLFGGKVLTSSNPSLGVLDLVPVETLLAYFDGLAGVNATLIIDKCNAA